MIRPKITDMVGDITHVCNRGVNKMEIFLKTGDYARFLESLYKCNNQKGSLRTRKHGLDLIAQAPLQNKLVDILKWSLLPNHYHLLLHEQVDGGITEFIKRIGNSYTKYFNIKNNRSGYLFQNSARIIPLESDRHALYIGSYIELNPLDLYDKTWREGGTKDPVGSLKFLMQYKWSSLQDYYSYDNLPALINKDLYYSLFETNNQEYQNEIKEWLNGKVPQENIFLLNYKDEL